MCSGVAGYVGTELGRANEALTSFANGVDDIVQSPSHSQKCSSDDCVSSDPCFSSSALHVIVHHVLV